ncbi:MAG: (deoxy)nucleoside triphosphate pyrophosphohydrolase [Polyangiales bacterium]
MTTLVAAAVVVREGKVLLTRRMKGSHLADLWEFPGGKLEPGEAPEAAVVRECREECDVEVRVIDILDVTFHRYGTKDVLLLFYDCELVSGEVKHLGVADHVWVLPEELDRYELPPADVPVVRKLKARSTSR